MDRCKDCLILDIVPGVILQADGVCNFCHQELEQPAIVASEEEMRQKYEADLERTLKECRGKAEYDCVVPLSGGKDSIYLLYRLKRDYGLNVLAFTVDANIPPIAWNNIRRTLGKLDIDHVTYRPSLAFYEKLFRYLLRNQEERGAVYTVSYVYAPLFEGDAIKLALEKGIPLVLAGYSPGQPEPDRMLYEFSRTLIGQADWTPPELKLSGQFSDRELRNFFNPTHFPAGTEFPRYLAPFHAWTYNQEEIMRSVVDLGLVATSKYANPIHSNYPINWLLMYSDLKAFGYNPYLPEFSALIRRGKASRNYWRVMLPVLDFMIINRLGPAGEVMRSLKGLALRFEDLRITKPRGAYDPILPGTATSEY